MVGFDQNGVRPAKPRADLVRHAAHVRRERENPFARDAVAHALVRVVRGVKGAHAQRADGEVLPHRDDAQALLQRGEAPQQARGHRVRRENRRFGMLDQHVQPGNMIGVLMRDEHSADVAQG